MKTNNPAIYNQLLSSPVVEEIDSYTKYEDQFSASIGEESYGPPPATVFVLKLQDESYVVIKENGFSTATIVAFKTKQEAMECYEKVVGYFS